MWTKTASAALMHLNEESIMSDHKLPVPTPSDFKEAAQKSEDAGIADETSAMTNAIVKDEDAAAPEAHPS